MRRLAPAAVIAVACGPSATPPPADPAPSAAGVADPSAVPLATSSAISSDRDAGAVADPAAPLGDAECAAMVDHAIDVNLALRRERGVEHVPEPEAIDQIRGDMKAEFVPMCRRDLTRAIYRCWMRAATIEALEACQR